MAFEQFGTSASENQKTALCLGYVASDAEGKKVTMSLVGDRRFNGDITLRCQDLDLKAGMAVLFDGAFPSRGKPSIEALRATISVPRERIISGSATVVPASGRGSRTYLHLVESSLSVRTHDLPETIQAIIASLSTARAKAAGALVRGVDEHGTAIGFRIRASAPGEKTARAPEDALDEFLSSDVQVFGLGRTMTGVDALEIIRTTEAATWEVMPWCTLPVPGDTPGGIEVNDADFSFPGDSGKKGYRPAAVVLNESGNAGTPIALEGAVVPIVSIPSDFHAPAFELSSVDLIRAHYRPEVREKIESKISEFSFDQFDASNKPRDLSADAPEAEAQRPSRGDASPVSEAVQNIQPDRTADAGDEDFSLDSAAMAAAASPEKGAGDIQDEDIDFDPAVLAQAANNTEPDTDVQDSDPEPEALELSDSDREALRSIFPN